MDEIVPEIPSKRPKTDDETGESCIYREGNRCNIDLNTDADVNRESTENERDLQISFLAGEDGQVFIMTEADANAGSSDVLDDLKPAFVILFDPNVELIRKIEVYQVVFVNI